MKTIYALLCAFCLLPIATALQAETAYDALPSLKVGQSSRFETWYQRDMEVNTQIGEREQSQMRYLTVESEIDWKVLEVMEDGKVKCQMKYLWFKMTSRTGDQESEVIDTRRKDDNPGYDFLKTISDGEYIITYKKDGTVLEVTGVKDMQDSMDEKLRDSAPDNVDFVEAAGELGLISSTPASLKKGASWSHTYTTNQDLTGMKVGSAEETVTYTVKDIETIADIPVAILEAKSQKKYLKDLSELPENVGKIDVKITYPKIEQKLFLDLDRKEVVGRTTKMKTEKVMTRTLAAQGQTLKLVQTLTSDETAQVLRIKED